MNIFKKLKYFMLTTSGLFLFSCTPIRQGEDLLQKVNKIEEANPKTKKTWPNNAVENPSTDKTAAQNKVPPQQEQPADLEPQPEETQKPIAANDNPKPQPAVSVDITKAEPPKEVVKPVVETKPKEEPPTPKTTPKPAEEIPIALDSDKLFDSLLDEKTNKLKTQVAYKIIEDLNNKPHAQAVSILFSKTNQFVTLTEVVNPLAIPANSKTENIQSSFNALSYSLNYLSPTQVSSKRSNLLSLVEKALSKSNSVIAGIIVEKDLTAEEKTILDNKKMATKLLQARHNFIVAGLSAKLLNTSIDALKKMPLATAKQPIKLSKFSTTDIKTLSALAVESLRNQNSIRSFGFPIIKDEILFDRFNSLQVEVTEGNVDHNLLRKNLNALKKSENIFTISR